MDNRHSSGSPDGAPRQAGFLASAGGLLGGVLRLAAGLLAFVLLLGALLVGAALALGLVAWALLRGRKPQAQVFSHSFQRMRRGQSAGAGAGPGSAARSGTRAEAGAVIDVEVREVPDNSRPTSTLRPDR